MKFECNEINTHEKRAEYVKRYEIRERDVRSTAIHISGFVAVGVAFNKAWIRRASHHNFLPSLAYSDKYSIDHYVFHIIICPTWEFM